MNGHQVEYDKLSFRLLAFSLISLLMLSGCTTDSEPKGTYSWENLHLPVETGYELFLQDDRLYVAAGYDGLYALDVSDSTMVDWEYLGHKVTEGERHSIAGVQAINAYQGDLFIRSQKKSESGRTVGVWLSEDRGFSWQPADRGMSNNRYESFFPNKIIRSPHNPQIMLAGNGTIFRSEDGGMTWKIIGEEGEIRNTDLEFGMKWHPTKEDVVWAYGQGGFFQPFISISKDAGKTWEYYSNIGVPVDNAFYDLAFDPEDPEIIYVGAQGAVIRTLEGGDDWLDSSSVPPLFTDKEGWNFEAVETHPEKPGFIFAGAGSRLYTSADYGETDHIVDAPPGLGYIFDMWYDNDSERLFISGVGGVYILKKPTNTIQ